MDLIILVIIFEFIQDGITQRTQKPGDSNFIGQRTALKHSCSDQV